MNRLLRDGSFMFATLKNSALVKTYVLYLALMVASSMQSAVFILYILELGGGVFEVNLISTISGIMGILFIVPFGILSDRFGRRPMLLFSQAIQAAGAIIYTVATHFNHLLIAAFVSGFTGLETFPLFISIVVDIAKPEERQEAINTIYIFSSIGMILGPSISSFLLTFPQITLRNIFQIIVATQIGIVICIATQIKETKRRIVESSTIKRRSYLGDLIRQKNFQVILAMTFLWFFSRSIVLTYIPILSQKVLNLSNVEIASYTTYQNIAIMLIRLLQITFLKKVPTKPFLISAVVVSGITDLASPFANSYLSASLVFFFSGVSHGAVMSLGSLLIAMNSTPQNRGTANSIFMGFLGMGMIMKILTSPIVDILGFSPVFILGGIIGLIAAVPLLMYKGW